MGQQICEYGCGQPASFQFKNGKWCCSNNISKCNFFRDLNSSKLNGIKRSKETRKKISISGKGREPWNKGKKGLQVAWNKGLTKETDERVLKYSKSNLGKKFSQEHIKKLKNSFENRKGFKLSEKTKKKLKKINSGANNPNYLTIRKIKEKYKTFSKVEKMRYNPEKPGEKEIQIHCKNNNCLNSKEQGGWFTPSKAQINERIRQIEQEYGNDGNYFYCSNECKNECPLYNLKSDPLRIIEKPYTESEYQTFRNFVLERDNYTCQYCGEEANHVHHERPQKLEPFFSLDPDYAWSCCKKCHYEKGHIGDCSTGAISNKVCM